MCIICIDFIMARMFGIERAITANGAGTPAYMAPELWRNKVHPNSDQYSLAVSYAEMRIGRPIVVHAWLKLL